VGIPQLRVSMSKTAVGCKFAVPSVKELALDCFVVAVGLAIKELLLFAYFIHI